MKECHPMGIQKIEKPMQRTELFQVPPQVNEQWTHGEFDSMGSGFISF